MADLPKQGSKGELPKQGSKGDLPKQGSKGLTESGGAGSPHHVAEGIFRSASTLGGFLIVAIVSPLGCGGSSHGDCEPARRVALSRLKQNAEQREVDTGPTPGC